VYFRTTPRAWCVALALLFPSLPLASAQTTGSTVSTTTGTPYRVLRSIAGAAGHEDNSKFVMDDARSLFNAGKDSKVVVYSNGKAHSARITSRAFGKARRAK
jgi:hypothetical protein